MAKCCHGRGILRAKALLQTYMFNLQDDLEEQLFIHRPFFDLIFSIYINSTKNFTQSTPITEEPSIRCYPQIFLNSLFQREKFGDKGDRFAFPGFFCPLR